MLKNVLADIVKISKMKINFHILYISWAASHEAQGI